MSAAELSLPWVKLYETAWHGDHHLADCCVLVTGGAGFIGHHLVSYLLHHGAKVTVLDNLATGRLTNLTAALRHPNFNYLEGDIRSLEDCRKAVLGQDFVLHQAALGSVPRSLADPITSNDVNVGGFLNMLVASRDAGVKRFIYAASSSTYGDSVGLPKVEDKIGRPLSPYAVTKYVNELYADVFSRQYGLQTIGLRYFNVFGPGQDPNGPYAAVIPKFLAMFRAGQAPNINGDGEISRDFTFVANAVQANIKAMVAGPDAVNEVFNVAVGARTSINLMAATLQALTGAPLAATHGPDRQGDIAHSQADISKAQTLLGYQPTISVIDGLRLLVEMEGNS